MGKFKGSGGSAAATIEAEAGFSSYDEATYGVPPKGPYKAVVRRLEATETGEKSKTPGEPMVKMVVEIKEPAGTKKAKYNGYAMWTYLVANEQAAGRFNQFLQAIAGGPGAKSAALIKSFWTSGAVTDAEDKFITKIGVMKIDPEGEGIPVGINTRADNYNDEPSIRVGSFMPIGDMPESVAADPDDEDDDTDPEGEEGDEDADEEIEERREELGDMTLAGVKKAAKEAGLKLADYKGKNQSEIIELIIDIEFPLPDEGDEEDPDEEGGDDDEAREEREEELGELSKIKLKAAAKAAGGALADYKALDEEGLIEFILDLEFPADDGEDEPEEDGDGEEDEEKAERREELEELTAVKLKAILKGLGLKLAEYRNKDEEELVELVLANEFPDEGDEDGDEDEPEEEPEPPAKPARRGAKAAPARGRRGKKDEPPF